MAVKSFVVIKVKYGETLRRFNALVVDERLDLNMDGFRDKIYQLFNFAPDSELTLTYMDEDGDVVTLLDDEDLQGVISQGLNPLRIPVNLVPVKSVICSARSSGSSTTLRSPWVQPFFPNLNSSVSDILKSVPEPLRKVLIKLSAELASRASSSASVLAELVGVVSKIDLTHLNLASNSQLGAETSSRCRASAKTVSATVSKDSSSISDATSQALTMVRSGDSSLKKNDPSPALSSEEITLKSGEPKPQNLRAVGAKVIPKLKALESVLSETIPESSFRGPKPNKSLEEGKKHGNCRLVGKAADEQSIDGHLGALPVDVGGTECSYDLKWCCAMDCNSNSMKMPSGDLVSPALHPVSKPVKECTFTDRGVFYDGLVHRGVRCDSCGVCPISGPRFKSKLEKDSDLCSMCFERMVFGTDYIRTECPVHKGVCCDGCGVLITGPRIISKLEDYVLCSECFAQVGNHADYIILDSPVSCRHHLSIKGLYDSCGRLCPPTAHQVFRGCGLKPGLPMLDSCFMEDVTILDGTVMAPLTPFTKVWSVKNIGNVVWPLGTRLVWSGGEMLSDVFTVELEITLSGIVVGGVLDVVVKLTAPELPGRYVSFWSMASPSGQKFGPHLFVLIQVEALVNLPKRELVHETFQDLNMKLPPACNGIAFPDIIDLDPEPVPVVIVNPNEDLESKFSINDSLLVGFGDKSSYPSPPYSSTLYPAADLSVAAPAVTSAVPPAGTDILATFQDVRGHNEVEATLLKELEEMGFEQVYLNKEILRMNEYDLEQSVCYLSGVAEWDHILEDLEEMGFCDKEMNQKLLLKNNGSIKHVVMDLVAGEK